MRLPNDYVAPARLLVMFVLLTLLPLVALGWLGRRVLEQDRALDAQRQVEKLQNTANVLADTLLETATADHGVLPSGTSWVIFDAQGVRRRRGVSLPHYPAVPPRAEPADLFAEAESIELTAPALALERYGALSQSADRAVRAGAFMRMARTLRQTGRIDDALSRYGDLAALGDVPVAGAPSELVGRRARVALLDSTGDARGAANERGALATVLTEGRYALDLPTFTFYSEGLPATREPRPDLTAAVQAWWPRWHTEPSGRAAWTAGGVAYATVWAAARDGSTVAMIGSSRAVDSHGQDASRRTLLVAGFALMALVILAAGYFVFRAVHRELNVAQLQSEFVAQVSHEFRTPLTAMRHLTELLEEEAAPAGRLPEFHRALGKETRRLHALVESLLDFGRIESGRQVYDMADASLAEIARSVVNAVASSRVHLVLPDEGPRGRIDRDALTLAVQNLVDNAIKYSADSSPVTVSVSSRAGRAGISVHDEGIGMTASEQRHVRRKFVRGSAAQAMNVKGTGIGLAIVDQVAKAHGGRLEVDSQVGRGSRFTIWVPLAGRPS